jgi:hypothetical protein
MDKEQVSAAPADREAWMQEATMTDLHAQIMNIPCKPYDGTDAYTHYCRGHRDARHAAAELASEALRAAAPAAVPLQPLTIFKQALLAYADEEYCRALRMFRTEPCLGWEAKAKSGKYGPAEHDAHRKADEHMGAHRGIYAAVRAADAMLAASPPPPAAIAPAPADPAIPQGEPVLWAHWSNIRSQITPERKRDWAEDLTRDFSIPLYAAIPQAVRNGVLSDEQIEEIAARMEASDPGCAFWREFALEVLSAASAPKEPTEPVPARPSEAVHRLAAEQFPLPPAKVQAYADTNGLPPADVKTCESCPTCGAPVTVFQPKVGEPIYTHNPAAGVVSDGGKSNG